MRGDVLQLFSGRVVEINIGVRGRTAALLERDELLVVGDIANGQAGFVFVDQSRFEVGDRHLEDVKETRVALVGGEEKRLAIVAPTKEVGLHLIARRQIALSPISFSHVQMTVFVSATIISIENARVSRKIGDGIGALLL